MRCFVAYSIVKVRLHVKQGLYPYHELRPLLITKVRMHTETFESYVLVGPTSLYQGFNEGCIFWDNSTVA
jgi:hypothetical protein